MNTTKRLIAILLYVLLCAPIAPAQDVRQETQTSHPISQDVTIIIGQRQVRLTAQKSVEEMWLQIFDQSGELVYDSGAVTGPELNWLLQNGSGEAIKSGLYAYTLSIKDAGAAEPRVRRGHFIVDRAGDCGASADRLWITSQGDSGVGTELTVARSEENTVAGAVITSERTVGAGRGATGREGERTVEPQNDKTGDPGAPKAPIAAAANGTVGKIAKFTSTTNLGDSGITEQNGNVGIGTNSPVGKLQVVTANDTNPSFVTAWDARHFVVGGAASSGGIGLSYDQNNQVGHLYALSPNVAWRNLVLQSGGGNVGIGTTRPESRLHVRDSGSFYRGLSLDRVILAGQGSNDPASYYFQVRDVYQEINAQPTRFVIRGDGNVGIGTGSPSARLEVVADYIGGRFKATSPIVGVALVAEASTPSVYAVGVNASAPNGKGVLASSQNGIGVYAESSGQARNAAALRADNPNSNRGMAAYLTNTSNFATAHFANAGSGEVLYLQANGGPFIKAVNNAENEAVFSVNYDGTTVTKVLQITGGADFAEQFEVNEAPGAGSDAPPRQVQPGLVVSIDPDNPGKLVVSNRAYDRRVAGIISGAGGVKPGMTMSQEGTLADGKHPVALSGRVYCWVDATQGAVEPGDLLTTSATPGHAMKVNDPAKAQGAIIGKAMTGLKEGKGLVLVLVTLQ